ncbi:TPA: HlyD family secretion protein [Escherichia coli]|nr:HlyD family secretion protein [Escherichia coli]HAN7078685.1 HlyD family secretion protein [Escherichia coli]
MMKKPVVIGLAVVVLAAVVAGGYWWYQSRQDNGLTLYGNVDIRTVNLSFRVGGRVESLAVDEGDAIKAGQVLGELDHKPYEIALMQAKAGVSVAQAQYDLMLAGYRDEEIAQAAAAVKQAQAAYDYAQNFYNRQQGLWKSRTISANDLENARSSRDQAQAELNLQDSTLIAPSDGTLLTRAVEPGTVLNEGGTVFTVSLTRPVWVRAYVDERNLDQAQPGRKVLLYTDGRPDKPYHGQIGFVSPTAEFTPKTVETPDLRTDLVYRLRIVVTDADDALRQGMPVTVQFGDEAGHE